MPATIVHVALPTTSEGRVAFGSAGKAGTSDTPPPHFVLRGTINKTQLVVGDVFDIDAIITIDSPVLATFSSLIEASVNVGLDRLTFEDGRPASVRPMESSSLLTPTGFAIESAFDSAFDIAPVQRMQMTAQHRRTPKRR